MFKLFWVEEEEKELENKIEVEIMKNDEKDQDEEVWQVALDILDSDDYLYIVAPIAWVWQDEIDISLNKTVLTISWTRQKPEEYFLEWVQIKNSECFFWKFSRNIILPENLDFDRIKAQMQNNLIVISIPKLKFDIKNIKINKLQD